MNNKLIIRKSGKTLMSMNFKEAKKSLLGELDIMIDSANKIPFEKLIAGDNYLRFESSVHAISWHGYYQISKGNTVKIPTVHFKDDISLIRNYKDVKHMGTININEPFAFPICSLYVPIKDNWLEGINISDYPTTHRKLNYIFKNVESNKNQRLDIFITPRMLSARTVLEGKLGFAYKFADVSLYNSVEGCLIPLKEIQDNPNFDQNSLIETVSLGNGHDVIIRTVGDQNSKYAELEGCYLCFVK